LQFTLKKDISIDELWKFYAEGKQTYNQLAAYYGCSKKTIQRKLDSYEIVIESKAPRAIVVLMDTTYWGRNFGVMLFKDGLSNENLLKYYVKTETNYLYKKGIEDLQQQGFTIQAIVCDGRKGLLKSFADIPVQMCQFHQVAIIRRYLTKNPKLPASIELKALTGLLTKIDKASFTNKLANWYLNWEDFLNERTTNPITQKSYYTHKRLRSAYRSLKTNLAFLFTCKDYKELNIPNTTNAIDGHFANLKNKMRNHNGMSLERKKKFIDGFLKA